jgi:hypothetical protein
MERLLNVTTVVAIILLLLVLFSIRRAHIRVEYSVSWLAAAAGLIVLSRMPGVMQYAAEHVGLGSDPPLALFLSGASVFLIMFFRYSVIVSHLRDDNIALAQRVAILEFHIHQLRENSTERHEA